MHRVELHAHGPTKIGLFIPDTFTFDHETFRAPKKIADRSLNGNTAMAESQRLKQDT